MPVQARRARELVGLVGSYVGAFAAPLRADGLALSRGDVLAATALGKVKVDDLRERFAVFNAAEERLAATRRAAAKARAERASVGAGAGLGISAVLLLALAAYLRRSVLDPVRRVARAVGQLADGRLDARVPVDGSGEIALLGGAFNTMAGSLAERERDLRLTNDRLQGILDHATTAISVKDPDGRYVVVNRRWLDLAGVDEAAALGRTDHEADIAGQLADLFARSTPELLGELRAASDGGDAEGMRRAAHKLNGSCRNVGAGFMATLAGKLEREAGEAEGPAAAAGPATDTIAELEAAFEPTRAALDEALGSG